MGKTTNMTLVAILIFVSFCVTVHVCVVTTSTSNPSPSCADQQKSNPRQYSNNNRIVYPTTPNDNTVYVGVLYSNRRTALPNSKEYETCGDFVETRLFTDYGFLYAVKLANRYILNDIGVTLGIRGVDSCNNLLTGVRQTVQFIADTGQTLCNSPYTSNGLLSKNNVVSIMGVGTSDEAMISSTIAQFYCIPTIWTAATTPQLDDPLKFNLAYRTVPSDTFQVDATNALLQHLNWTFVAVVYEDNSYGRDLRERIRLMPALQIEAEIGISDDENEAKWESIRQTLNELKCRVLVVYTDSGVSDNFFNNLYQWNMLERFVFVGADGWSNMDANSGIYRIPNLAITTEPRTQHQAAFYNHITNMRLNESDDPWVLEFIRLQNECCFNASAFVTSKTPCVCDDRQCSGDEVLSQIEPSKFDRAHFAMEAIFLVARALRQLHDKYCPGTYGLCEQLNETSGAEFRDAILDSTFDQLSFVDVTFPDFLNHSAVPSYSLFQYQGFNNSTTNGTWQLIGTYNTSGLFIENDKLVLPYLSKLAAELSKNCSQPCSQLQLRTQVGKCFQCDACDDRFSILTNEQTACQSCEGLEVPDSDLRQCIKQNPVGDFPRDGAEFKILVGFGALLFVITLIASGFLLVHYGNPITVQADRLLSALTVTATLFLLSCIGEHYFVPSHVTCLYTVVVKYITITVLIDVMFVRVKIYSEYRGHSNNDRVRNSSRILKIKCRSVVPLLVEAIVVVLYVLYARPEAQFVRSVLSDTQFVVYARCTDIQGQFRPLLAVIPIGLILWSILLVFQTRHKASFALIKCLFLFMILTTTTMVRYGVPSNSDKELVDIFEVILTTGVFLCASILSLVYCIKENNGELLERLLMTPPCQPNMERRSSRLSRFIDRVANMFRMCMYAYATERVEMQTQTVDSRFGNDIIDSISDSGSITIRL